MVKWHRILTPLVFSLLSLLFSLFVLVTERINLHNGQKQLQAHAALLAKSLWNLDQKTTQTYLTLVASGHQYQSMTVTDLKGEVFCSLERPTTSGLWRILLASGLIPRPHLSSPIVHAGKTIGRLDATWLPRLIFVHAYALFTILLITALSHLYSHILKAKLELEQTVQLRTSALRESNQQLIGEIGEHAKALRALRQSEEKHRLLAENISDVIWTTDLDLNYTYISPVSTQMHGWREEELSGLGLQQRLTPESQALARQLLDKHLSECVRTGNYSGKVTTELEMYKRDGSTMWGEISASLLLDEEGIPVGLVGVTRDISGRLKADQERTELHRQLEQSRQQESLALLTAGVAQELNNILSGLVSYPELLLNNLPDNSPLGKPILTIRDAGLKASALVQDLLVLTRRKLITKTTLNLNTLIEDYLHSPEHHRLQREHPGHRLLVRLADQLPDGEFAAAQVRKTLANLIIRAMEAQLGTGTTTISTGCVFFDRPYRGFQPIAEGEYFFLTVQDQGQGIADRDLGHIFEPFYTRRNMGQNDTGLGLTVVLATVQDHDGSIDVQTIPGHGTSITLYLPMSGSLPVKMHEESARDYQARGETILVIDHLVQQQKRARGLLQQLGYLVHTVGDGEAALTQVATERPDLILLDMMVDRGMDGLTTLHRLRQCRPELKILVTGGQSGQDLFQDAQELGATGSLTKPFQLRRLGQAIRTALDQQPP